MAAEQGNIIFPFSFETATKQLLDKKMYVENYSDLITYTTDRYLFKMPVFVAGLDDPTKTGWYLLRDPLNPQLYSSWQPISLPSLTNTVVQIGSFSFDSETYEALLGETLNWIFDEAGNSFSVGESVVLFTAPDITLPRVDIITWNSVDGYVVTEGEASNDPAVPNTPIGDIFVRQILRNIDGTVEIPPAPDLTGVALRNGGNTFTGMQFFNDDVRMKSTTSWVGHYWNAGRQGDNAKVLFRAAATDVDGNLYFTRVTDAGAYTNSLKWIRATGQFEFLEQPTKGIDPVDAQDFVTKAYGDANYSGGGGAGTITSVNGDTGPTVVLDADDIDDTSTTNKYVTAADLTTLSNTSGVNTGDQDLSGKQDVLTEVNFGNFMDVGLSTKLTPTSGDALLARDIITNEAVEIPYDAFQPALGFTPENLANKENTTIDTSTTKYPTVNLLNTGLGTRQPLDATLTALAAYNTNGILTQTASDTFTGRTITGTTNQVNVTNGSGVAGNPTLSLPQDIHTAATPQFTRIGLSAAANAAAYITAAANTTTVGQLYFPPSAVDYTGTLSGMLWNNASEWKFYDGVLGSVNRFIKLNGNSILSNSNSLNVVTSTGTGGNLGTLPVQASFTRYPTAVSYTVLLTDIGFGSIIAVTSTAAARTVTLPLANAVPAGFQLTVKDESGLAGTNAITIARQGSDVIDGATSILININYQSRTLYSDGVSKWFII